jgi:hypothetical protein
LAALGCPEKPKFWLPPAVEPVAPEIRCPIPSPATTAKASATTVTLSARSGCRFRGSGGWY